MFKRILVATDGSAHSDTAFDYAIFFAKSCKSCLVCGLSVVDVKMLAGPFLHDLGVSIGLGPFDTYQPKVRQMLREKAEAALSTGAERCGAAEIEYEPHLVDGIVSREILARAESCDMLVMGKLGEHASWRSSLLGHTAENVTRACHHPVLVTPEGFVEPTRALIPYDASSHAYDAMHNAGEIAMMMKIPLVVVAAHPDKGEAEEMAKAAERYLLRYEAEVSTIATDSHPEEAILETARDEQCNLIIMGAYGHSRIRELVLGSTTEQVMRRAECPILLHR